MSIPSFHLQLLEREGKRWYPAGRYRFYTHAQALNAMRHYADSQDSGLAGVVSTGDRLLNRFRISESEARRHGTGTVNRLINPRRARGRRRNPRLSCSELDRRHSPHRIFQGSYAMTPAQIRRAYDKNNEFTKAMKSYYKRKRRNPRVKHSKISYKEALRIILARVGGTNIHTPIGDMRDTWDIGRAAFRRKSRRSKGRTTRRSHGRQWTSSQIRKGMETFPSIGKRFRWSLTTKNRKAIIAALRTGIQKRLR